MAHTHRATQKYQGGQEAEGKGTMGEPRPCVGISGKGRAGEQD
jgi:hypothetical protein